MSEEERLRVGDLILEYAETHKDNLPKSVFADPDLAAIVDQIENIAAWGKRS